MARALLMSWRLPNATNNQLTLMIAVISSTIMALLVLNFLGWDGDSFHLGRTLIGVLLVFWSAGIACCWLILRRRRIKGE
jgi:hypothetical protein